MKKCNKCGLHKDLIHFYKNCGSKDGLKSICKQCVENGVKEARKKDPERFKNYFKSSYKRNKETINKKNRERFKNNPKLKKQNRLRPYNLTEEEFDILMNVSNYKCNICNLSREDHKLIYNKDLHIDHCHNSEKIRGILCHNCNLALGNFKDNIDLLNKAINYLSKWQH